MTSLWLRDDYFSKTKVTKLMYIDTNPCENNLIAEISIRNQKGTNAVMMLSRCYKLHLGSEGRVKVGIFNICAAQIYLVDSSSLKITI